MTAPDLEQRAINVIRGLAMDAPHAARSGHQGTAMALAPLAHVLWTRVMRYDAGAPEWPDRDRFVLSAGHASILLYSMLHLTGYDLSLDDLRDFRQWGSKTPGHPERGHTDGVEVTTGPLGPGLRQRASAWRIAERQLRARFGADLVDHRTFCIVGDGDLSEGLSHEAASLAGHLGLGRLVCVYDDNHVSIDGPTELALSDDAAARFRAYGWHVERPRRGRRGPRRPRGGPAAGHRRGGPPVARDPAQPHRLPVAVEDRRPRHPRLRPQGRRDPRGQGRHGPARRDVLRARRRARALPRRR